jgi:glycosyltransferase involved in cell wall biosynthesis
VTFEVSVVTCSHNPRPDYLKKALEGLRAQTLDVSRWEYLVVDNASTPPLATNTDLSWHPNARIVEEGRLGLTWARLRGIEEAKGELLVFVDDDNVLDPDFLTRALRIAEEWPHLGAWSGQTTGGFESEPPEWTKRYWGNLVIRSVEKDVWSNLPHFVETMPCGAGLCVRSRVAGYYRDLHLQHKRDFILDRTGDSLVSAGDNDLAACACDLSMGVGLFASLKLTHLIPPNRLTEDYLVRLAEGTAFSGIIFRSFRSPVNARLRLTTRIADIGRMMRMGRRERRFFLATRNGEREAHRQLQSRGAKGH